MIQTKIFRNLFRLSHFKDVLVEDIPLFDLIISDIPDGVLGKDVSSRLAIPYLSECNQDIEQINKKIKYTGVVMGFNRRLFLSIPTAYQGLKKFYYVHYLINTTSPFTSLTPQAYHTIMGKSQNQKKKTQFGTFCLIGGRTVQVHHPGYHYYNQKQNIGFMNANILGMNFFCQYKKVIQTIEFKKYQFQIQLFE